MNFEQALGILKPTGNDESSLKESYRAMAMKHHPDVNPHGLELMKLINAAYEFLKNHVGKWDCNKINKDNTSIDEIFQDILDAIKHLEGIAIEICGTWIWVSGDTRPYKDAFKENGMKWAPKKKQWYWRPDGYRKRGKKVFSMDEIRAKYGSEDVESEPYHKVA